MYDATYFRSEHLLRALLKFLPELRLPSREVIAIHRDALFTLVGSHKPNGDLSIAVPLLSVLEAYRDEGLVHVMNRCMHDASSWGMARVVQQFLHRGADPGGSVASDHDDIEEEEEEERTSEEEENEDEENDGNCVYSTRRSPLFLACCNGFKSTVKVLVGHGAQLSEEEDHLLKTRQFKVSQLAVVFGSGNTSDEAQERRIRRIQHVLRHSATRKHLSCGAAS